MDKLTAALALLGLLAVAGMAGVLTEPVLGRDGSGIASVVFAAVGLVVWLRVLKRR